MKNKLQNLSLLKAIRVIAVSCVALVLGFSIITFIQFVTNKKT